jgi:hypothetical protein
VCCSYSDIWSVSLHETVIVTIRKWSVNRISNPVLTRGNISCRFEPREAVPFRAALHHARFQGNSIVNTVTTQQYCL